LRKKNSNAPKLKKTIFLFKNTINKFKNKIILLIKIIIKIIIYIISPIKTLGI
jgi:hypothetical protein